MILNNNNLQANRLTIEQASKLIHKLNMMSLNRVGYLEIRKYIEQLLAGFPVNGFIADDSNQYFRAVSYGQKPHKSSGVSYTPKENCSNQFQRCGPPNSSVFMPLQIEELQFMRYLRRSLISFIFPSGVQLISS